MALQYILLHVFSRSFFFKERVLQRFLFLFITFATSMVIMEVCRPAKLMGLYSVKVLISIINIYVQRFFSYFQILIATETMESPVDNMKRNLLEKAKSFFYQLRWLFCISVPDESDGFVQKKDIHLRQLNHVQPSEQFTKKTFCDLPNECKLAIFSYLSPQERGMAERVCMEWKELMRAPSLWNSIDLTQFKIQCYCEGTDSACLNCYEAYKDRIEKFLDYLLAIEPNIKSFRFAFDISDFEDDWMRILMRFLTSVQITDLQFAYLNWKETPEKRIQTQEVPGSLVDNSNDTMSKHRRRQRHFERFFHFFTQSASRVSLLVMPFDWSLTSIQYIGRLHFLKTLVLRSYSVPQPKIRAMLVGRTNEGRSIS